MDWLWQLPAVSLVGVSALALALGPQLGNRPGAAAGAFAQRSRRSSSSSWCSSSFHSSPDTLSRRADGPPRTAGHWTARDAALRAHALEPWATAPLEQLALARRVARDLVEAQRWADAARRANADDWQVRLLAARIETRRGAIVAARGDLRAARRLNPRSPLFSRP